jgi:hypothetical protein
MYELLADALKALAAYPPVAAAAALVVLGGGVWLMIRGERDRKSNGGSQALPGWALYGPVSDALRSVHHISEQGRETNQLLNRIEDLLKETAKEQREQTQLLEALRNEGKLR